MGCMRPQASLVEEDWIMSEPGIACGLCGSANSFQLESPSFGE